MTTPATQERHNLADELLKVGPDAPTLDEGWDTRMLAAHIVLRDRRPDAATGIVVSALSAHTEKVQKKLAKEPWDKLVAEVRQGPPAWSPTAIPAVNRFLNTIEFFVHLEDVRRAQKSWDPRDLDSALQDDLYAGLKRMARQLTKKAPDGITLAPTEGTKPIVAHDEQPMVTVTAPIGELVLWTFGRQSHALVTFDGPDDAIAALNDSKFGL